MSYCISVMFAMKILISLIILYISVCVQGRALYAEKKTEEIDIFKRQEYNDTRRLCLFDVPLVDTMSMGIMTSDWTPFMNSFRSRISGFKLQSDGFISCFGLIYGDIDGPCHGGTPGDDTRVEFAPDEYITEISGRLTRQINQLTIKTNQGTYGAYGPSTGAHFSVNFYNKILAFIGVRKTDEKLVSVQLYFYCQRIEVLI